MSQLSRSRAPVRPEGVDWARLLAWFVRLMALVWFVKGLSAWTVILDVAGEARPFEARSLTYQAAVIWFSVVDITASVGLWLLAPWGRAVWLLAAISRIVLAVLLPALGLTLAGAAGVAAALVGYGVLTWLAERAKPAD